MQILRVTAVLALMLFVPASAFAARDLRLGRGFKAEGMYQFNGIDSINQLSGALNVQLPIGQEYATTGSLKYQFTLSYSSNIWDYRAFTVPATSGVQWIEIVGGSVRSQGIHQWWVDYVHSAAVHELDTSDWGGSEAYPAKHNNVGVGWMLTLGDLKTRDTYVSPDGSEHFFWSSDPQEPNVLYTHDSTYLRMTRISDTTRTVDTPDGLRRRFICVDRCSSNTDDVWLLDQIADPYGNLLWVERSSPMRPNSGSWVWTYHEAWTNQNGYADHNDITNLPHEIRHHTMTYSTSATRPWELRLESLDLAGYGGHRAIYNFHYALTDVYRDYASTWAGSDEYPLLVPYNPDGTITVSLLARVEMPMLTNQTSGTLCKSWEPETAGCHKADWRFGYWLPPPETVILNHQTFKVSQTGTRLSDVFYPTGGSVHYEYTHRDIPEKNCGSQIQAGHSDNVAVMTRQVRKTDGSADGSPWRYHADSFDSAPLCSDGRGRKELQATTIDPLGNATVTFFSVYKPQTITDDAPWKASDWGLPITKAESDEGGRNLSTAVYHCPDLTLFDPSLPPNVLRDNFRRIVATGTNAVCGPRIRATYLRWEQDGPCGGANESGQDCYQTNRRVKSESTRYFDDGNAFISKVRSDFDGYGHYRQTLTSGNFNSLNAVSAALESRLDVTQYKDGGTITKDDPWVLGTYTETRREEGGKIAKQQFDFDAYGYLSRKRVYAETTPNPNNVIPTTVRDVVTKFERTPSNGAVTVTERSFGGDAADQHIDLGDDLHTLTLPPSSEYRIDTTYRYGSIESGSYVPACGGPAILSLGHAMLDSNTGLPLTVYDSAETSTGYDYDQGGRLLEESPADLAPTTYEYAAFDSISVPPVPTGLCADLDGPSQQCGGSVTISRKNGNVVLTQKQVVFDHVGRIRAEREKMPAGMNERWSFYFANGWKDAVRTFVEKGHHNPAGTVYQDYDPFGRAGTVINPDGTKIHFDRDGDRYLRKHSDGADNSIDVEEKYDSFGRLAVVGEISEGTSRIATTYVYDVTGHLGSVTTPAQPSSQPSRFFTYDGRGFPVRERHPEIGAGGNGWLNRTFDSHGNPLTESNESDGTFNVQFEYDKAERPVAVSQMSPTRLFKQFSYYANNQDPQNGTDAGAAAGKLFQSVRHNWIPDPARTAVERDVTVKETYYYHGRHGSVSTRRILVSHGYPRASETFTYDLLGNVTTLGYPTCTGGSCLNIVPVVPARSLELVYDTGRLSKITGFADGGTGNAIRYSFNGMVNKIRHFNGITDTWTEDDYHMTRPKSINAGSLWQSGTYTYGNAAGNITAIGGGSYQYAPVGRLTSANVGGRSLAYTYDHYGNLLTVGSGSVSNNVDSQTNRRTSATTQYDAAGDVTTENGFTYTWDPLSKMRTADKGSVGKEFVYSAGDERVGIIDYKSGKETWTFRGLGNEVLREYEKNGSTWTWRDYIYRGRSLLAAVSASGTAHYHLDHLGSTRAISDANGVRLYTYLPFGEELSLNPPGERMKFTGHERDDNNPSAQPGDPSVQSGDLDYMHARYYSFMAGRFLSVDPASGRTESSQSWNRYSYAANNPVAYVDPDGRAATRTTAVTAAAAALTVKPLTDAIGTLLRAVTARTVAIGSLQNTAMAAVDGAWRLETEGYSAARQWGLNQALKVRGFLGLATEQLEGGAMTQVEKQAFAQGAKAAALRVPLGVVTVGAAMFFESQSTQTQAYDDRVMNGIQKDLRRNSHVTECAQNGTCGSSSDNDSGGHEAAKDEKDRKEYQ